VSNKDHTMRYALLALPLMMAACASDPAPVARRPVAPQIVAPAAPAPAAVNAAPGGLDGRWIGTASVMPNQVTTDGVACRPARLPAAMTVNGGRAALSLGRGSRLEGTITADGMVTFSGDAIAAQGSFQGRGFQGEATRQACGYRMTLTKRGR